MSSVSTIRHRDFVVDDNGYTYVFDDFERCERKNICKALLY